MTNKATAPRLAFLMVDADLLEEDAEVLNARYAAWVRLAKMTRGQMMESVLQEWEAARKWVDSDSDKPGSFRAFCDAHDLDVSAVRRAIRESKQ